MVGEGKDLFGRVGFAETGSIRFAHEAPAGLRPSGDDPARMAVNINEPVWVRLTDHGRQIMNRRGFEYPKDEEDGRSRWQLWSLMEMFGAHITMSGPHPFDLEIEIGVPAIYDKFVEPTDEDAVSVGCVPEEDE